MIGMAAVIDDYPLYYDAMNEKGLCMAGLNFPGNACYLSRKKEWKILLLSNSFLYSRQLQQCGRSRGCIEKNTIRWNEPFIDFLPLAPLHWIISDQGARLLWNLCRMDWRYLIIQWVSWRITQRLIIIWRIWIITWILHQPLRTIDSPEEWLLGI